MPQAIHLRNYLDPLFPARLRDLAHLLAAEGRCLREFWPGPKIEVVVELQNERIHPLLGKQFANEIQDCREVFLRRSRDVEAADREHLDRLAWEVLLGLRARSWAEAHEHDHRNQPEEGAGLDRTQPRAAAFHD